MKKVTFTNKSIFGILFFAFLALGSCTDYSYEREYTYYKFTPSDNNQIVKFNYTSGQIIMYENQFGEQLHFKVISNISQKCGDYSDGTFSGGGGSLKSYYDSKIIKFQIIENQANFTDEQVIYQFSKSENEFKKAINFPIWNRQEFTFFDEIERPFNINLSNYGSGPQMTINGHTFEKVVLLNSGSNLSQSFHSWAVLPDNVNQLYYDFDFGIIQFNDLDGKEWKVIYPQ